MASNKIFLCHASVDKWYVQHVAERLGRARIHYDAVSFQPGQDFRSEIQRCLSSTGLFVFFVSKKSLDSAWCRHETREAAKLFDKGIIDGALALLIDHETTFSDLPEWLKHSKATRITAPSAAMRTIESAAFAISGAFGQQPYIPRTALQDRLQTEISSTSDSRPRIISVSGLDGIGRRSYLRFAAKHILGMEFGPVVRIDDTRRLDDIYLTLLEDTATPLSTSELANELKIFQSLPMEQRCKEIASRLHSVCTMNHFPCFMDSGGMLDENGKYRPEYVMLFQEFLRSPLDYLGIVHKRKPSDDLLNDGTILFQFVPPLNAKESLLLLAQLLRRQGTPSDPAEIEEFATCTGGYPPAIQMTANHIAQYGLSVLTNQSYLLTDFTARRFSPLIQSLGLSDDESRIMQYLACELPLGMDIISVALDLSAEVVASSLIRLIDLNIVTQENYRYTVSAPLIDAIVRVKGFVTTQQYETICERITSAFWAGDVREIAPSIDAIDATLHAALMGEVDQNAPYMEFVRASTVHRLANEAYHQKNYAAAEQYARRTIDMDHSRDEARSILARALIQQAKFTEAQSVIESYATPLPKIQAYLRGFLAKKRYQWPQAILHLEEAIAFGNDSVSVHRDLADCLFRAGRLKDAMARIERARSRGKENAFVLDLAVKIYLEANRVDQARECLKELERSDVREQFIHQLRASLLAKDGNLIAAYESAQKACDAPYPPFEAFGLKVNILMKQGKLTEAQNELDTLDQRFKNQKRDIVNGLRCKLFTLKRDWRNAQVIWEQIKDKGSVVHRVLLFRLLEVKGHDVELTLSDREAANKQAAELSDEISKYDVVPDNFWDPDDAITPSAIE